MPGVLVDLTELTGPLADGGVLGEALTWLDQACFGEQAWSISQWRLFSAGTCRTWAAVEQGEPVGFLVCQNLGAGEVELVKLGVSPQWRRCGVALNLLHHLESLSGPGGRIFLEVRASNQPARALYERAGFVRVGVRKGYYSKPKEDAILYEKR